MHIGEHILVMNTVKRLILLLVFAFAASHAFGENVSRPSSRPANPVRKAQEMNTNFSPEAFKGHTVFAWKEASGYSFVWLSSTNALIPRKRMVNASPISECVVTKRFKEMKGLRQHVSLYLIPDAPQALRFYTQGDIPKTSMDASLDLIERLEKLAKENQVFFVVSGSDGDRTLDGWNEAPQQEAQTDDFIGFAEMEADGTLILRLYAYLDDNDKSKGHVLGYFRYPPDHPEYENILRHVGPIKPGEDKPVRPWPETSDIECNLEEGE